MNCKQGDLAIVVRSVAGNEGKIVRCLKLEPAGFDYNDIDDGAIWVIDRSLNWIDERTGRTGQSPSCPDINLRPIRDNPGPDETLTWEKNPERVEA